MTHKELLIKLINLLSSLKSKLGVIDDSDFSTSLQSTINDITTLLNNEAINQEPEDLFSIADSTMDLRSYLDNTELTGPFDRTIKEMSQVAQALRSAARTALRTSSLSTMKSLQEKLADAEQRLKAATAKIDLTEASLGGLVSVTEERIDSVNRKIDDELAAIRSAAKFQLDDNTEFLIKKQQEITAIVGHEGAKVLSSGYAGRAIEEKKAADLLRNLALLSMALVCFVAYITVINAKELNFPHLFSRFSLILLLSVPATYLTRESAKHRANSKDLFRISLDLAAAEPFIGLMDKSVGDNIREKLATRLFKEQEGTTSNENEPINAQVLLEKLIDKLDFKSASKSD